MHFTLVDWIIAYFSFSGLGKLVNNFSAVSLTPAINFRLISDRYQRHRGTILSPVSLTIVTSDDRGLFFLQKEQNLWGAWGHQNQKEIISDRRSRTHPLMVSFELPWRDASIDTPHTLIRDPWGRKNYFNLWPSKSDTAGDSFIRTAMKRRGPETPHTP